MPIDEKINILVVDDRPENLMAIKGVLERPELSIITATSGSEALGLVLEHTFALILLDVQMSKMDGFEVAGLMRSSEKTRHIVGTGLGLPIVKAIVSDHLGDVHVESEVDRGSVFTVLLPMIM